MTAAMMVFLALLAVSITWATYQYAVSERSNRVSWTAAPLPRMAIQDGPYRSTSVERRLASAPFLVKVTAFICFFVGLLLPRFVDSRLS